MINTSQGPKSPAEALELFKKAQLPKGDLLGIFNQLNEYPESKSAREHVLANPSLYSDKLQRLVQEKSTGRPIGAKVINSESDLRQILYGYGVRARVAITIRKEQAHGLRLILCINNLEIDEIWKVGLHAVAMSGEWQSVPRTFNATLSLTSDGMLGQTAQSLFGVVEKIELISTLTERVKAYRAPTPLSEEIKATLAANPDLFYDRSLFLEVCEERAFSNQQERVGELSDNATMEDVIMLFLANSSREEFLEYYIARFVAALT
ncbi:MAG: hypothetical protein WCO12_00945 [bacterium]